MKKYHAWKDKHKRKKRTACMKNTYHWSSRNDDLKLYWGKRRAKDRCEMYRMIMNDYEFDKFMSSHDFRFAWDYYW